MLLKRNCLVVCICYRQVFFSVFDQKINLVVVCVPESFVLIYHIHIYIYLFILFESEIVLMSLKLVLAIFNQFFYFSPNDSPSKAMKMFFISSKKLFSFSRYSNFCIFVFPSFFPVSHCFRGWSKKNLKIHVIINCLNKNLIIYFVLYLEKEIRCDIETLSIDRALNKEHFYGKIMQKMRTKS